MGKRSSKRERPALPPGRALPVDAPGFEGVPQFCDFGCVHAEFPPAETAGICRTMSAVWCAKLGELVHKNMRCEARRRAERA